ncbi:EPIDERMAL PATTERNING FACTOR-like protein 3 [Miscanthus floridulus]|uniref:EPIDERMAL PATTERNING FACTOR-like protein 3 n=1 Tax=Miscanthus floridulus TaxID=154761 RepID=UPI0034597F64
MSADAARRLRWQHRAAWSLLLFFFVVLPLLVFMAQGGQQEPAHVGEDLQIDGGGHAEQQQLSRLGSRPPCCDRKCGACAPCTAVQVRAGAAAEREPGLRPLCANYEPVGWKCRCGAAVFDP